MGDFSQLYQASLPQASLGSWLAPGTEAASFKNPKEAIINAKKLLDQGDISHDDFASIHKKLISEDQSGNLGAWFAKTYPSNDFRAAMLGMAQNYPAAAMAPAAPQGWDAPLPNISLNTLGRGRPRLDASLSVPALGGQLGIEGNYQRNDNQSPASWAGKLGYSKSF